MYKPNPENSDGIVLMKVSDLSNPLDDTFDLSECGEIMNHLVMKTGYNPERGPVNEANKIELSIAPRFLIANDPQVKSEHLKSLRHSWAETSFAVGISWSWAGDKVYWFVNQPQWYMVKSVWEHFEIPEVMPSTMLGRINGIQTAQFFKRLFLGYSD